MKKILILVIIIAIAGLYRYFLDLQSDRAMTIEILKTTPIFAERETIKGTSSIGNVEPGEKLKVLNKFERWHVEKINLQTRLRK